MKIYLLLLMIFITTSCKETSHPDSRISIKSFRQLFGKVLECNFSKIKTKLLYFSPHVVGVPIKENEYEMEYFRSVGSKRDSNSLYYESNFKGKANFQTLHSVSNRKMRRLRMTINEGKLFVTAVNEIDDNKIPVNPVLYECEPGEKIKYQ